MTMRTTGLAKRHASRPARPYIEATSPAFLRILADAKRELEACELGMDGKPRNKGGRPRKERAS
jgi:hypothetical protein